MRRTKQQHARETTMGVPSGNRIGQQLGNYRLLRLLGQGGQASVYLGEHVYLKSQAALKVRHAVLTDEERTVFLQEAQTLVRLTHPHIVRVLDFDVEDDMPFLVMEYAPHGTLRQRHPRATRLPLDVLIPYVHQVASALQYTHDQRLIHRDVKPENMLLGFHEEILLSDFGLVMLAPHTLSSGGTEPMEQSLAGTTPYLAPEQLRGKARPASDQYALGVVVYEWLCGKPPFQGPFLEVAVQHISVPPPSMREQVPGLSPAIEEVVLRALAKEPDLRFARVQDFATALEHAYQEALSPRLTPVLALEHRAEAEQRRSSIRDLPTGTVTFLFTDIEGSTTRWEHHPEAMRAALARHDALLRSVITAYGGFVFKMVGDAVYAAFAMAADAVAAAVAGQRVVAAEQWGEVGPLRVRMALHTGAAQSRDDDYFGPTLNRVARLLSSGHGGQVLLSAATQELTRNSLPVEASLKDLGEHALKDLLQPEHVFQLVISDLPADFPPLKTLDISPNNLPIQPTPFIGREQEVAAVGDLLRRDDVHLLTLTGPGGTGKTRLGLQVAAELSGYFADGIYFIALAPISDPALVMSTVAETIGIREMAGQPLIERLKEELRQKQMLLLLDNFEQVVSAASQVAGLLVACSHLKMMVTSREVLHVRAEHEFAVPPLALPDPKHLPNLTTLSRYAAVALFLQRAQAVKPDFQMTNANARAIVEICARLDGLPLAIELAAARMKLLSPQALLTRLSQRLQVLTSAVRDVPTRQQTLRNTIAWSYDLLDAAEQRLFRRLSVFVGGYTLEALEAVCAALDGADGAGSVLDGVSSLIDKSLLQQIEQEGEEPRLMMLETIREYGLEALAASGEMDVTRHAHATCYLALAEKAELEFDSPQQAVWLERLEQEHQNLRAALQWLLEQGEAGPSREMALRLGAALRRFWDVRGHWSEGRSFLERALAVCEGVAASVRAKALRAAANLALTGGDHDRGEVLCEECLVLCRKSGDKQGAAYSLYLLGYLAWMRSNYAAARSLIEESLAFWREVGERDGIAWSLGTLADVANEQGEYTRGRALYEQSLALHQELGNKRGVAYSLCQLAQVLYVSQSDTAPIHSLLEESLALLRELGHKEGIAWALGLLGQVFLQQGDVATARSLLEESVVISREIGTRSSTAQSLSVLARAAASEGDYAAAYALYEESLAIAKKLGNKWLIASCLEGLADVVAAQGSVRASLAGALWAARLWGAAEALRDAIGAPLPPVYHADYDRSVAAVRSSLGVKAFAIAWAEGRTMTPEQVLSAQGQASYKSPVSGDGT